jgi:hypothetical protein
LEVLLFDAAATLERQGTPMGAMDLPIAAHRGHAIS